MRKDYPVFAVCSAKALLALADPKIANSVTRAKVEVKAAVCWNNLVGDTALTAQGRSYGHKLAKLGNPTETGISAS